MLRIPVYNDNSSLQPTPVNPETASTLGREIVDVSEGLSSLGETIRDMNNKRQTLQAQIALSQVDQQNWKLAATDPDLDTVADRIKENSTNGLEAAADLIKDPSARNAFVADSTLDMNRKGVALSHHIFSRQSDAMKTALVESNDALVEQYKNSADPAERELIKQKSYQQTEDLVSRGYLHGPSAVMHLDTLWKKAAIDQVKDDAAVDAEHTLEELQKGQDGLYKDISEKERGSLFKTLQKQLEKQGMENNHIMEIARNQTELQMIDKMAAGALTMDDVTKGRLGATGVPARPEFAKAAQEALEDPFPTASHTEKWNEAVSIASDTDIPPDQAKVDILKIRGLSHTDKARLISTHLRKDPDEAGKSKSLQQLIQDDINKNKQEIMDRNAQVQKQQEDRRKAIRGIFGWMKTGNDKEDAQLQQDFIREIHAKQTKVDELHAVARGVINKNNIIKNPKIAMVPEEGKLMIDAQGNKAIVYPDGSFDAL